MLERSPLIWRNRVEVTGLGDWAFSEAAEQMPPSSSAPHMVIVRDAGRVVEIIDYNSASIDPPVAAARMTVDRISEPTPG